MKRFYNNTIMSGAFSKVLRVFALLCVLFGVSGTAWGDEWLVGSFNNWTANDDTRLNYDQNKNSYQIELEQSATLQEFKIKQGNDTYFGAGSGNKMTGDSEWRLDNSTNVYLEPTVTGPYTFFLKRWEDFYPVIQVWYPAQAIYVTGDAATDWGVWEQCTGNGDIISVELKKGSGKFKFSNTNNYNNEWYQCQYRRGESIGATLSGNRGDDITVNLKNGYGSPVYFKYNKKTGYIWVEATKGGGGDESDHTYALAGDFNNWSTSANSCKIKSSESCVQQFELTKGEYGFKVLKDGSWYGKNSDNAIGPNNSTGVSYTTNTADQGDNITLNALNDGIYTFTITDNNDGTLNVHIAYEKLEEPVLISHKPVYDAGMQNVDLFGYVQKTLCNDVGGTEGLISDYGFVICPGSATAPCNPTIISQKLKVSGDNIPRGTEFTYKVNKETDRIIANTVYGYRAYVVINDKMYLSEEVGTFMLPGECNQPEINTEDPASTPIVFTIDASLGETYADDCNLIYGSLQTALDRLLSIANEDRADEYQYTKNVPFVKDGNKHNSINLQVPIVFNVMYFDNTPEESSAAYCYQGNVTAGVSGGGTSSENSLALIIKDINRNDVDNPYTLTIQNGGTDARPWLHHVIIRNSRNVILDNLAIFSDPTGEKNDDALEFDINNSKWDALGVGEFTNSKIVVKNCMIGSNGFTGVHASAYDGITFENNEFEVVKPSGDDTNVIDYGASAKFIACSNIKFIRNNFRGAHATLLWIQDSHDALFINNVFWNTNEYAANASAIRLVNQFANKDVSAIDKTKKSTYNLGFYYNTFFLQDDKVKSTHKYDFLHYSSLKADDNYPPKFSNIEFMYNNCYSYDTDVAGKYQDPTSKNVSGSVYCPNNFWSKYDDLQKNTSVSAFEFGCETNKIINVENNVCATTATGPASLVVSGTGLNKGVRPTTALAVALGVSADYVADRYNDNIRPVEPDPENINNAWTFGAYQSQSGVEVSKIYWLGLSENWDDRNNWGYYPSENTPEGKSEGRAVETIQRLSCINALSEELHVVIPEKSLLGMPYKWPVLPGSFTSNDRLEGYGKIPVVEQVSAGLGKVGDNGNSIIPEKFAETIELEYGAAIKGVEHLAKMENGNKTKYYGNAKTNFSAIRSQWILVGTVVRPWDETLDDYRDIKSGDYYIPSQLPHVYMHEAVVEGKSAKWDKTFTSLEVPVPATKVFAITIPDQYGKYKIAAKYYNKYYGGNYDANDPINYVFTGEFVNDTELPSYSLTAGQPVLLNNSYPANIDAKMINKKGSVLYYNYDAGSFMSINAVPDASFALKPQHGFLFIPNSSTLTIEEGWIMDGTTRTRSGEYEMPVFSLNLYNANTNKGYSNVAFGEDEFLAEGEQSFNDTEKIFASSSATPELYIILNDGQYSYVEVPSNVKTIPLGVRLAEAMNIRFEKAWFRGFTQVILVDTKTGKEYNLLEKSYTTETLEPGDIEGRFYINIEEAPVVEEPEEGGDISTEAEENIEEAVGINIYVEKADNTVKVVTNGVELKEILVSDMAGRTITYQVSGYSASLKLPVPIGVYMINVIGDKASRTEKVVLK